MAVRAALRSAALVGTLVGLTLTLVACGRPDQDTTAHGHAEVSADPSASQAAEDLTAERSAAEAPAGERSAAGAPTAPGATDTPLAPGATGPATAPDATDARGAADRPAGRRFTIAAAGDVMPHGAVIARAATYGEASGQPFDFRPMFAEVAPILRAADLAICNLETPLATDHADVSHQGFPLFNAPRELGEALADAGFTGCSTANNHATDAGVRGVVATLEVLDEVGMAGAGTGRTPEEAAAPRWYTAQGVEVAHLAASGWVNVALPAGSEWMVELIDVERLIAQARAARDAGAEFVVVSLHHGIEYQIEPSEGQRSRAEALLASGAVDLILGHHAHVVQPVEQHAGGIVFHGLGNLLSNQRAEVTGPATQDGVIVLVEVGEQEPGAGLEVTDVAYVPTWVDRERHVIVDVWAALGSPLLDAERRLTLVRSWERTVAGMTLDGADAWGVTPTSGTAWFDGDGTPGAVQVAERTEEAAVARTRGPRIAAGTRPDYRPAA